MMSQRGILKLAVISGLLVVLASGGFYFYHSHQRADISAAPASGIVIADYDEAHDTAEILDIFKVDRYWLLSSVNYSPEFMLKNKAPSEHEPEYFGKMRIKVLRDNGVFCGFAAYFKKNFAVGQLLFLATKRTCRGKGYGRMLLNYVMADMKNMGLSRIFLFTRSDNVASQSLYRKSEFTFIPLVDDDEHVSFEKEL